ncbi:hypothetical protein Pst134EA_030366 [Puccinia striiformis f. sp. tritici]|uniref:hypothetical protein n=1 Tax=Puccinia striiformis f. sp. tritici TaxID=168172 RepID=UPI0020082F3E|nr:hypothetical protein Pst134EA_030366 [Puccinia striiformis f. sp. tritici]KAH9446447.1 hypothetical protein Pst134EA_030366 [Puccinia striiformis f. sp. tritici]
MMLSNVIIVLSCLQSPGPATQVNEALGSPLCWPTLGNSTQPLTSLLKMRAWRVTRLLPARTATFPTKGKISARGSDHRGSFEPGSTSRGQDIGKLDQELSPISELKSEMLHASVVLSQVPRMRGDCL